jgi:hypothetical protein
MRAAPAVASSSVWGDSAVGSDSATLQGSFHATVQPFLNGRSPYCCGSAHQTRERAEGSLPDGRAEFARRGGDVDLLYSENRAGRRPLPQARPGVDTQVRRGRMPTEIFARRCIPPAPTIRPGRRGLSPGSGGDAGRRPTSAVVTPTPPTPVPDARLVRSLPMAWKTGIAPRTRMRRRSDARRVCQGSKIARQVVRSMVLVDTPASTREAACPSPKNSHGPLPRFHSSPVPDVPRRLVPRRPARHAVGGRGPGAVP